MPPSTIAGRYTVQRAVGHGGMGTVWLCRDEVLSRDVAVKEVGSTPGSSTSDLARALREARNSAALNHRNVVSIYDAVEEGDHNWLVMEYVPSRNLSEMVGQDGPLPPERAVWIGAQAADGLAAAHIRGTMHRDVKPGNILVTDDDHVKITDFGIARTHGDAQLTKTGVMTGTPAYFAPELAKGNEPTLAADVWALGASLYAAIEGRLPYPDQTNAIALLTRIASGPPSPPRRADFMREPIARMMDPDPSTRWTMSDVAHTLHRLHDQHPERRSGPSTVSLTDPFAVGVPDEEPRLDALVLDHFGTDQDDGSVIERLPESATEAMQGPTTEPADEPVTEASSGRPTEGLQNTATETEPTSTPPHAAYPPPGPADERPIDRRHGSGRRLPLAAVVLLAALVAFGLYLNSRDQGTPAAADRTASSKASGKPDSGGSSKTDTGSASGSASGGSKSSAPAGSTKAPAPQRFVEDYYSSLPRDTETAWKLLSPAMQAKVGGYGAYAGFWRTISAVRVDQTTSPQEGTVDVRLTYTSQGGTQSETRRLRLEKNGDSFLIAGDQVI